MKLTKRMLRNRYKATLKAAKEGAKIPSFKKWVNDNGKDIVSHYKDKSVGELEYTDETMKLLLEFL